MIARSACLVVVDPHPQPLPLKEGEGGLTDDAVLCDVIG